LIENRKDEHILLAAKEDVEFKEKTTFLEYVELIHNPTPEISLKDVNINTEFLGYELEAPIVISGITGGTSLAKKINRALAKAANELKVAIGVGSQRIMLKRKEVVDTFKVVREEARDVPVIGNIGASQVVEGISDSEIDFMVNSIGADAIAIHLNPLQEAVQVEGEPNYKGLLSKIRGFVRKSPKPVIVKETGAGIPRESAAGLINTGIIGIDVGGAGGTSFSTIEGLRSKIRGNELYEEVGKTFAEWGIPLAASIVEVRSVSDKILLIATGGIRSGLDMAKSLRLGADLCGIALPLVRAAYSCGAEGVAKLLRRYILELRTALFLTGSRDINELKGKPAIIYGRLKEWIKERRLTEVVS